MGSGTGAGYTESREYGVAVGSAGCGHSTRTFIAPLMEGSPRGTFRVVPLSFPCKITQVDVHHGFAALSLGSTGQLTET